MTSSTSNYGQKTSKKRCTDYGGNFIKEEITVIANGKKCVKTSAMVGGVKEVERSCINLEKKEEDSFADVPFVDQDSLEDAIQNQERYTDWWNDKLDSSVDAKMEALERQQEEREMLEDTRRDIYERLADAKEDATNIRIDSLQEKLERQADQREALLDYDQESKIARMERQKELMEKRAELYEEKTIMEEEEKQDKSDRSFRAISLAAVLGK